MLRYEYLRKLDRLLKKLPDDERREAMAWYEEYFEEAGPENEEEVINRLGSPKLVAAGIRADIAMKEFEEKDGPKIKKGISAVWVIILSVFALPIGLPIAIAMFAAIFSLLMAVIAVLISLYATALGLGLGGVIVFFASFAVGFQNITGGVFYFGASLFMMGGGTLLFLLSTWVGRVSVKGLARLIDRFRRGKRKEGHPLEEVAANV